MKVIDIACPACGETIQLPTTIKVGATVEDPDGGLLLGLKADFPVELINEHPCLVPERPWTS